MPPTETLTSSRENIGRKIQNSTAHTVFNWQVVLWGVQRKSTTAKRQLGKKAVVFQITTLTCATVWDVTSCLPNHPPYSMGMATRVQDNCHQYFTQKVTVGHDLMQLRKNQNFLPLTDHNSAATIYHSKMWDPQGKFLTGIWLIAVSTAACWVWAIRKRKLSIQVKCVPILVTSLHLGFSVAIPCNHFQWTDPDRDKTDKLDFSWWCRCWSVSTATPLLTLTTCSWSFQM